MKNLKKLLSLMLAFVMVLALAACGGGGDDEEGEIGGDDDFDDYPLTIKVWQCNTGNGQEYLASAAADFNASQDKYIIDMSYGGSYQDVLLKISTSTKDSRPDIFASDTESMYPILANQELFVPIQTWIDKDGYDMSHMITNLANTYSVDGVWQCMPLGNTVTGFFYNDDVLAANGIDARADLNSYQEILEACRKLKAAGVAHPFYMHTSSGFYSFPMTAQGIQYVDNNNGKDAVPTRCLIGDEGSEAYKATVDFFQFLKTMTEEDLMLPFGTTVADGRAEFVNQNCVIYSEFISSYHTVVTAVADAFTTGFHECPTITKGAANVGQCTGGGCFFLANTGEDRRQEGAWEFMKFLMQDEYTAGFAEATGYLPTTITGFESAEYQSFIAKEFPTAKYSIEAQENTSADCYNAWLPMFSDFHQLCREYYSKACTESKSAEELTVAFAGEVDECIDFWHASND